MTLLDNGWTKTGSRASPEPNLDRGNSQVETGAPPEATILVRGFAKRIRPPSMGNLSSSPMSFAIPTKELAWLSSELRPLTMQERQSSPT